MTGAWRPGWPRCCNARGRRRPRAHAHLDHTAGRLAALLGDGERAAARLGEAARTARAAGALGVLRLVESDQAAVTGDARPLARPAWGLTPRVEVLRLLAAGHTSQEIAGELVLALPTVNRHIANIYTKIDVRNRAEATSFAIARGLVAP